MPKRKAVGPVDSSDGEEEEYYSFPATPVQSPFPKSLPNNFNLTSSLKTSVPAATSTFSFGGAVTKRPREVRPLANVGKTPLLDPKFTDTQGTSSTLADTKSTNSNSVSGSANQKLAKSIRDLNNAFQNSVRNSMSKNASHSLIPLVKDYLFHSQVLLEQCKKGGAQAELVNGINLPPKTFKSLGEFFDDFEARYVNCNQENTNADIAFGGSGSALNSKSSTLTTETSTKSNVNNSTFPMITSPSKSVDNTNVASLANPETTTFKTNSFLRNPLHVGKPEPERSIASGFFASTKPMAPSPSTTSASMLKPSTESAPPPPPPLAKPAAPFTGFSFFTPPAPSTSLALGSTTTTTPATSSEEKTNDEEAEDDEPPKVEIVPVKEDDSVYSIRCKIFGVVDGKPKDKGIGMLYVKKLDDGRHQIVVRADNNLGTVILNILLQKSLPLEKNGKNSIMTVDLQANDKKGMPIFIKVKTENDAVELLGKLKEFQQSS